MLKPFPADQWSPLHAAHLLNRAGFGGSPSEIASFHTLGLEAAVDSLIMGEEEADLFPLPKLTQPPEMFEQKRRAREETDPTVKAELLSEMRKVRRLEMRRLRVWWLSRMRYTPWPLREKMTLFWHGHFATSIEKTRVSYLMWQQNETLRAYALGNFRELTKAISRDPAMMQYLDLQRSARARPNENFARELMELFTLGEGVRYSEDDVREAARALTGYRVDGKSLQFSFARRQFDDSDKTLLGVTGPLDGDAAIDVILRQPECGAFIGRKVWTFFVDEDPSEALVQALGKELVKSDYDLGSFMRTVLLSEEFYDPGVIKNQVKSPVQWLVQTAKVLEIPLPESRVLEAALSQMGQVLFAPPNVKGWDGGKAWITSATLLFRFNLAGYLVGGDQSELVDLKGNSLIIPLDKIAPADLRQDNARLCETLTLRLVNRPLPEPDQRRLQAYLIERPAQDDATIRDLLHLIMSTPEYQLT